MSTVADVMTRNVLTVTMDTPVRDVANLLFTRNISGVPVLDRDGKLAGIVSEGDLMGHVGATGERPRRRSWLAALFTEDQQAERYAKTHASIAGDVMTSGVQTVTEETSLAQVVRIMERHGVKRLPVMRGGELVGIVTRRDLLRVLATSATVPAARADDRTIRDALLSELGRQPWVTLATKNIVVEGGVVHLFGSVESEAERGAVIAAARTIAGVRDVDDNLAPALHLPF
ncbi:MAG: CBS domain-containing protein [Acetobacteraceae bacterium]|nr:CBS domain-containing protein [Acetobacteraceae bacterium]